MITPHAVAAQERTISTDENIRQLWTKKEGTKNEKENTRNEKAPDEGSKMTADEQAKSRKSTDHAAGPDNVDHTGGDQPASHRHAPNLVKEGIQDRTKSGVEEKDSGTEKLRFEKLQSESAKNKNKQGTSRNPSRSLSTAAQFDRSPDDLRAPQEGSTQEAKMAEDKLKRKVDDMGRGRSMSDLKGTLQEDVKKTTERLNESWEDEIKGNVQHATGQVSDEWEKTKEKAGNMMGEVSDKAKEGWQRTKEMAWDAAEKTQEVAETAKERIEQGLQGIKETAKDTVQQARETLGQASQRAFHQGKAVEERAKQDWEAVKGTTGYATSKVAETAKIEGDAMKQSADDVVEKAKGAARSVGTAAKDTVNSMLGGVSNQVRGVTDDVREGVRASMSTTAKKAKNAVGAVKKGSVGPEEMEKQPAEEVQADISRKKNLYYPSEGGPGPKKGPQDPSKKAARMQLATEDADLPRDDSTTNVKSKL